MPFVQVDMTHNLSALVDHRDFAGSLQKQHRLSGEIQNSGHAWRPAAGGSPKTRSARMNGFIGFANDAGSPRQQERVQIVADPLRRRAAAVIGVVRKIRMVTDRPMFAGSSRHGRKRCHRPRMPAKPAAAEIDNGVGRGRICLCRHRRAPKMGEQKRGRYSRKPAPIHKAARAGEDFQMPTYPIHLPPNIWKELHPSSIVYAHCARRASAAFELEL